MATYLPRSEVKKVPGPNLEGSSIPSALPQKTLTGSSDTGPQKTLTGSSDTGSDMLGKMGSGLSLIF